MRAYAEVFWERYDELGNAAAIISQIEKGEQKIERRSELQVSTESMVVPDSPRMRGNTHGGLSSRPLPLLITLDAQRLLKLKVQQYRNPFQQLRISYGTNKGRNFTEEEDRFLICMLQSLGYEREDVYEELLREVRKAPQFRFDWFLKVRVCGKRTPPRHPPLFSAFFTGSSLVCSNSRASLVSSSDAATSSLA